MRTTKAFGLSLFAILALSGCFKFDVDLELHPTDEVSGTFTIALDKSVVAQGEPESQFKAGSYFEAGETVEVQPYEDEQFVGESVVFNRAGFEVFRGEASEGLISFERDGDIVVISGEIDFSSLNGIENYGARQENSMVRIKVPGKVVTTNGSHDSQAKTIEWTARFGEVTPISATIESRQGGVSDLLLLVAGVSIPVLAIALLLYLRSRAKNQQRPSPATDDSEQREE
jgi:hypothetical protein